MSMANAGGFAGGAAKGIGMGQQFDANQMSLDQTEQMNPLLLQHQQLANQGLQQRQNLEGGQADWSKSLGAAGLQGIGGVGVNGPGGMAGDATAALNAVRGGQSGIYGLGGPTSYQGLGGGQTRQSDPYPHLGGTAATPYQGTPQQSAQQQGFGMRGGMPDFFNMGAFGQSQPQGGFY